jgi:hypothetical protein
MERAVMTKSRVKIAARDSAQEAADIGEKTRDDADREREIMGAQQ